MVTSRHCVVAVMELLLYFPSKQSKKKTCGFIGRNFPRNYPDSCTIPTTYLLRGGHWSISFGLEQKSENQGDSCNEVPVNNLLRALRRRSIYPWKARLLEFFIDGPIKPRVRILVRVSLVYFHRDVWSSQRNSG